MNYIKTRNEAAVAYDQARPIFDPPNVIAFKSGADWALATLLGKLVALDVRDCGCFTGDCSHQDKEGCKSAIMGWLYER